MASLCILLSGTLHSLAHPVSSPVALSVGCICLAQPPWPGKPARVEGFNTHNTLGMENGGGAGYVGRGYIGSDTEQAFREKF